MAFTVGQIMTVADIVAAGGPDYIEGETKEQYYARVRQWAIGNKIVIAWFDGDPHFYGYVNWQPGDLMYPAEVEAMGGPYPVLGETIVSYWAKVQTWAKSVGIQCHLPEGQAIPVYDGLTDTGTGTGIGKIGKVLLAMAGGLGIFFMVRKKK